MLNIRYSFSNQSVPFHKPSGIPDEPGVLVKGRGRPAFGKLSYPQNVHLLLGGHPVEWGVDIFYDLFPDGVNTVKPFLVQQRNQRDLGRVHIRSENSF